MNKITPHVEVERWFFADILENAIVKLETPSEI